MKLTGDETLQAILAHARSLRLDDVQAEIAAATTDPLLQDIVDQALAHYEGLTPEQRADAREALVLRFATDPQAQRLMEEIRAGGGKSHVVASRTPGAPAVTGPSARRNRGAR
jgi:hypothetical protein